MNGTKRAWRPLPAPHSRVRVLVEVGPVWNEQTIFLEARGTPDDLVACGLALPEWVPASVKGKRKQAAPDGSKWHWADRSPKKVEWRIGWQTASLEVAKRWPGVPADIAFPKPQPRELQPARPPSGPRLRLVVDNSFTANTDAREAYQLTCDAIAASISLKDDIAWFSVGAPGSAEKLREAAALIEQAATLIAAVADNREEEQRWQRSRAYDD